jgi:hypothetical protein
MQTLVSLITLPFVLNCVLAGCSSPAGASDEPPSEAADQTETATAPTGDAYTYFEISADLRKCPSPGCGGWFLTRLNRPNTQCHDGQVAASCYTPVLDWTNSGLGDTQQAALTAASQEGAGSPGVYAIVRGQFEPTNTTTPSPDLGRFVISEAWVAEGDGVSAGAYVRVKDNGLRCFAAPCPSLTETTLNTPQTADIAEVDWTPSGLNEAQVEECTQDMFTPDGLLVAGDRYTTTVNSTTTTGRTVTAAYRRLMPQ